VLARHSVHVVAPFELLIQPAAQVSQFVCPAFVAVPAVHSVHIVAPFELLIHPEAHVTHNVCALLA
jgi:hypothetical protein